MATHFSPEYLTYIHSPLWSATKAAARQRYGKRCAGCMDQDSIQMHHLFYPRDIRQTEVKHLLPLCERCHETIHSQKLFRATCLNSALCELKRREILVYLQGRNARLRRVQFGPKPKPVSYRKLYPRKDSIPAK